ncbi:MAG: hypothetical protein N2255_02340 [Kiritimatiellae bacterium]|nr:hypothetical protein [Kiritimatiellia bacterium]
MSRSLVDVALMLLIWFMAGCATPPVPASSSANPDRGIDLLICLEPTAFKELLALKIGFLAEQRGLETRTVDVRDLPRESLKNYRAAIIINSIWAGNHRSHVKNFLAGLTAEERRRVILVNTARKESWKTTVPDVHAITCASQMNRIDEVLSFLNIQLDLVLAQTPSRTTAERGQPRAAAPTK